ncbi:MAG: hypothetical protein AAFR64_08915 [Pseudomonadota bacterium]
MTSSAVSTVETVLRDELARANRAANGVVPVLGHLLASSGHSLVSDVVVARVRGMLTHIARQFVARLPNTGTDADALTERLSVDPVMLSFVHAAAMEGIIAEALEQRASIDPVLSPLWQELIASVEPRISELAMQALASQSRFMQSQLRMQYPVNEMPPEMLERSLELWASLNEMPETNASFQTAIRSIKAEYDEANTRQGLLRRLGLSMNHGAIAALELNHAGLGLFVTVLAQLSGQSREQAVLSCDPEQSARLVLALRSVGMEWEMIERQFAIVEPSQRLPRGLEELTVEAARLLLVEQPESSGLAKAG